MSPPPELPPSLSTHPLARLQMGVGKIIQKKQISLRSLLLIAFVGQILGIVGLIGYLSLRNSQKTVNTLASQLRQELTARIRQELQSYFETPHEINRLNASAFARGELDIVSATRGEAQLYQQMKIAPNVALVYCGSSRKGEFFGVLRSPDDGSLQLSYGNQSNRFLRDYYSLDVSGVRTFPIRKADKPYDSRLRPWYQAAVSAQGPAWTDIYIAFTTKLPNITASLPVYDRSGKQLLGVCATDVVLPEEFRNFLRDLDIGIQGQAFVIDRKGTLISNSTDEPLMVGEGDEARSILALDSQDALVRSTAQYLIDQFGGFERINTSQQLEFRLNGQRQFLEVVPFQDGFGLDWLIVVVVPESDFMAQVDANTRTTIGLSLAAVSGSILLAILASRWITRPILSVANASAEMAKGNLVQQVQPTGITEINTMARSFNTMTAQLDSSFSALRQSEAQNRALIAAIPDLLIRASAEGQYLEIAGRDRLNIQNASQFSVGNRVYDSLPPDQAQQRMAAIHKALATGQMQVYEQQFDNGQAVQSEEVRIVVSGENEVLIMVRNITERKQAEAALRQSEAQNRAIVSAMPDLLIRMKGDGTYLGVVSNERQSRFDPQSEQDAADLYSLMPPDLADLRLHYIRKAIHTGEMQVYEQTLAVEDGTRYEEVRIVLVGDDEVLTIIRDITDRKQAAAQMLREKLFSDTLIDSLPGIFFLYDSDLRLVRWNKRFEQVLGYTGEATRGLYALDTVCAADRAMITQRIQQVFAEGEAAAETRLLTQSGETRPYVVTGRRISLGGATYLLGTGIDISEQKRAEEALRIAEENYRSIYENALEGIFQSSPAGRFLSVNPAMAAIYGYDSPQDMVTSITDIARQVYVDPEGRREFTHQMEASGAITDFEYRIYRKDGSIIWIEENTRAVRGDDGTLLYYEGIVQDITGRKRLEDDLRRQLEELQIEIDETKREQDVALITQSGYFQELRQEIAQVNLDEFWS